MNNLITLSTLFFALLILGSCEKPDPCEFNYCVYGYCVDGSCQCEDGYFGEHCDQGGPSHNENQPTGFKITSIEFTNYPYCTDIPDLNVTMDVSAYSQTGITPVSSNNANAVFNVNWEVQGFDHTTVFKIFENSQGNAQHVQTIAFDSEALLDELDNAYSTSMSTSTNCYPWGATAWVRIYFEIID